MLTARRPEEDGTTSLEDENRELRRKLLHALDSDEGGERLSCTSTEAPRYHIEQMSHGAQDGMYRLRCGFRVIGLFDTTREAWDTACLDFAAVQRRIQPATGLPRVLERRVDAAPASSRAAMRSDPSEA